MFCCCAKEQADDGTAFCCTCKIPKLDTLLSAGLKLSSHEAGSAVWGFIDVEIVNTNPTATYDSRDDGESAGLARSRKEKVRISRAVMLEQSHYITQYIE